MTIPTLYQDNHARFAGALLIGAPRMRYLHAIEALRVSLKGATMTQRVARLCSAAHDLMHYIATTYGVSDNPADAAEQAMDRADGKVCEGGRL